MNEPKSFRSGNTVTWTDDYTDYPANDGWTATCYLRGLEATLDIAGNASGTGFIFTISAADSAALPAGKYKYITNVSKAGAVHTVSEGTVEILVNLQTQAAGYDGRTLAEKMVAALEATIYGRATKEQQSIQIAGKAITLLSPAELRTEYFRWQEVLRNEQAAEAASKGLGTGQKILVRMVTPT